METEPQEKVLRESAPVFARGGLRFETAGVVSPPASLSKGLSWASLEIGRVLADRKGATFRARGTCMYPSIRSGDVLHIDPCEAKDVALGDIAVGRKPGFLFAHRVIGKGLEKERPYLITRPDMACLGSDGPIFDDTLLGRVVRIERRGRQVSLKAPEGPWASAFVLHVRLAGIEAAKQLAAWFSRSLKQIQECTPYRNLARTWIALFRPRISYTVRLPMPALAGTVYRELPVEAFDSRTDWRGRPVELWTLAMRLNEKREAAAWATFTRRADGAWQAVELFVRPRYRGAALEASLLHFAATMLSERQEAPEEPKNNKPLQPLLRRFAMQVCRDETEPD